MQLAEASEDGQVVVNHPAKLGPSEGLARSRLKATRRAPRELGRVAKAGDNLKSKNEQTRAPLLINQCAEQIKTWCYTSTSLVLEKYELGATQVPAWC